MRDQFWSIIEYFGEKPGGRCGYCKNPSGKFSHGMWAHSLSVQDYESLINRGWRRSGKYCYKPTMKKTCCPQYEIRCDVSQFKLSKSQKKVMKKMTKFLEDQQGTSKSASSSSDTQKLDKKTPDAPSTAPISKMLTDCERSSGKVVKNVAKGEGLDPNRPKCVKAKLRRIEMKKMKMANKNSSEACSSSVSKPPSSKNQPLTLEDQLPHLKPAAATEKKLELRLVRSHPASDEFNDSLELSYQLYKKYQMAVHNDAEDECTKKQWMRFLVDSPLEHIDDSEGSGISYGSFHNQYWIDGRLIAVGVVDVLPSYVSSVYVYYDPDFSFLSLGVYTALSEVALTRRMHGLSRRMSYYCLGYYIENCDKMRYKGAYSPSYLLCPETYRWCRLDKCRATLAHKPYSPLNLLDGGSAEDEDPNGFAEPVDEFALARVLVLYKQKIWEYLNYRNRRKYDCEGVELGERKREELEEIALYSSLVGRDCAHSMLLYRSSSSS